MNSCTLAITPVNTPEVRYTHSDIPSSQFLGTFYLPYQSGDATPSVIRVVGFGEFVVNQMMELVPGEQCIITGRLEMNTIENPVGFSQKKAELIANKIEAIPIPF